MTVAFDAFASSTLQTDQIDWTHTPVGTPRGIIVQICSPTGADAITGVTYGGVAMTEVAGSPNLHTTGEDGSVYTYFLGSNIPTGAQAIAATVANAQAKIGRSISLTAAADTEVVDSDGTINSDSVTDPSVTLSLGGRASFCAIVLNSGGDNIAAITPLTGWTSRGESDTGLEVWGWYTYDTIGTADVTAGWSQTTEDACAIAIAVSEVQASTANRIRFPAQTSAMGVGGMLGGNRIH